ncbi:MAG: M14 family metallopeptidase [Chloroflexota bacterium]|nr:M14 family metallopeptidase [Chloroflexota bacterium]
MTNLLDQIQWRTFPLPGDAAHSNVPLQIGQVGDGSPLVLITAGVHGDEGSWGAWAIRKLLASTSADDLIGAIRVVPNANPLAMAADARNAPLDVLDLNRSFPGSANGSHTEVLAAILAAEAVAGCDVAIDLHGGGSWCVNAFAFEIAGGEAISRAFGAPFIVSAPERTVTLTGYARTLGATVAAVEMGGRSGDEEMWAARIADGLRRALIVAGVLKGAIVDPPTHSIRVSETRVLRPKSGGLFVPTLRAADVGTIVPEGTLLGEVYDPSTLMLKERLTAPCARTAILLLRPHIARLEGGAMTYVIAEPFTEGESGKD